MNQKNYINHLKTSRNKISELFGKRQKSSQAKKFQAWAKLGYLKIICSEKATKFCKISDLHRRFDLYYIRQIYDVDFENFFGLLRVYEL
mgnify:CR=1 FL=1